MLAGFAANERQISRAVIEEVADTFDMLPDAKRGLGGAGNGERPLVPAPIFSTQGRAELWAAGSAAPHTTSQRDAAHAATAAPDATPDDAPDTADIGAAFRRWDAMGDR